MQRLDEMSDVDIFLPHINEVVDASVDTNAWTVKLSRQLLRSLRWQQPKGLEIASVRGQLDLEIVLEDNATDQVMSKKKAKLAIEEPTSTSETKSATPSSVSLRQQLVFQAPASRYQTSVPTT